RLGRIYFIEAIGSRGSGAAGFIKIGWSAYAVDKRLRNLQVASPFLLKILRTVAGSRSEEECWHEALANYCARGEWFLPDERVLIAIRRAHLGPELAIKEYARGQPLQGVKSRFLPCRTLI